MDYSIGWLIIVMITIFHFLIFGFALKKYIGNLPPLVNAILRGLAVGACVNYFFFIGLAFFFRESTFLLLFTGLPISVAIGIVTTSIFWLALSKLDFNLGFIERFGSFASIGVVTGIFVGAFLMGSDQTATEVVLYTIAYFCSINLSAGLMLSHKKFYDLSANAQENNR